MITCKIREVGYVLAGTAMAGALLWSTGASAALVSGVATLTLDNPAVIASIPAHWYFERYWGPADNNLSIDLYTRLGASGQNLSATSLSSLLFPVNGNTVTTSCSVGQGCGTYGRTLQATTMDAADTSTGQIGLSGALRMRPYPVTATYLAPYDFSLVKTDGTWVVRSFDTAFRYGPMFRLENVSESVDGNGNLLLDGDLKWMAGSYSWAFLLQANTDAVIGHFSLAPSAVPIPGAAWLFGSSLLGLLGLKRRFA